MTDQNTVAQRLKSVEEECDRLRSENIRLRAMLGLQDFHFPTASTTTSLTIAITFNKMQKPASLRSED
jgi:hypothetical protein